MSSFSFLIKRGGGYVTEHGFGNWGKLYGIAYGVNQKKGNVITLNNSGNVYAVYNI